MTIKQQILDAASREINSVAEELREIPMLTVESYVDSMRRTAVDGKLNHVPHWDRMLKEFLIMTKQPNQLCADCSNWKPDKKKTDALHLCQKTMQLVRATDGKWCNAFDMVKKP